MNAKNKITWDDLNERQQTYLQLIYTQDQLQEGYERRRATREWSSRPADQWRWTLYANEVHGHTPLKQAIKDAKMVDPGTGSTFKALEERGLILAESERINPHVRSDLIVNVQITKAGRKLVCSALNITARATLPVGTLREWHWRALCRAYVRDEQGIGYDENLEDGFGYVNWNTCLRLRDYIVKGEDRALIREGKRGEGVTLIITEYGKQYYRENWQKYQEMYPDVKVPKGSKSK